MTTKDCFTTIINHAKKSLYALEFKNRYTTVYGIVTNFPIVVMFYIPTANSAICIKNVKPRQIQNQQVYS